MYEIEKGLKFERYRTPNRTDEQLGLLNEAAQSDETLKGAALKIHAIYYGIKAKSEPDKYDQQISDLSKLISRIRRGKSL